MRPIQHTWEKVDGELREGKPCQRCKRWLPLAGFHKCYATHDKFQFVCRQCQAEQQREGAATRPETRKAANKRALRKHGPEYYRANHQRLKRAVMNAYGGKCACCGEAELEFLSLDHVDGGGHRQRKELGGGSRLWRLLRDAGWPKEGIYGRFRVLCMNCNVATRNGRTCPHQLKKGAS